MINLNQERLYILKALSFESTFVFDKYVPLKIKKILCDFGGHLSFDILKKDESDENTPSQELSNLYSEYGIGLIRCLLQNFYLIYSKNDLEDKLAPLIEKFSYDIKTNRQNIPLVLKELNQYAYAPFESLENFIDLLISEIGKIEKQYPDILYNEDFCFDLKYIVFKQLVEKKEKTTLLLEFLIYAVNFTPKYDFQTILFPLIIEYSKTEYEGFKLAFEAFNSGAFKHHGHLILASFGSIFAQQIFNEKPRLDLIRAIFLSFPYIQDRRNFKDRLMVMLIDKWCNVYKISKESKKNIAIELQTNRAKFLGTLSDKTIQKIEDFKVIIPEEFRKIVETIKEWANSRSKGGFSSLPKNAVTGKQVAIAFSECDSDDEKKFILDRTKHYKGYKFYQGFFNTIIQEKYFINLSLAIQNHIVTHDKFAENVKFHKLNSIKGNKLEKEIKDKILSVLSKKELTLNPKFYRKKH